MNTDMKVLSFLGSAQSGFILIRVYPCSSVNFFFFSSNVDTQGGM